MGDWADYELDRILHAMELNDESRPRRRRMSPFERARAAAHRTKEIRDSFDDLTKEDGQ